MQVLDEGEEVQGYNFCYLDVHVFVWLYQSFAGFCEKFGREQSLCFVIRFHPLTKVWMPGQSIGMIRCPSFITQLEVKLRQKQTLAGLTSGQVPDCLEVD